MKRVFRLLTALVFAAMVFTAVSMSAFAAENVQPAASLQTAAAVKTGWQQDSKGYWHYYNSKGKQFVGFKKIDGKWYFFDQKGRRRSGWQKVYGKKRYFSKDDGTMQTGFVTVKGKTYYCNSKGILQKGWRLIEGAYYFFNKKTGVMATGFTKIGSTNFYFLSDGRRANIGLYKEYIIGIDGVCHPIPKAKSSDKNAEARRVAKVVAECVGKYDGSHKMSDLERVHRAAIYVSQFCDRATYTMSGKDYATAYGVFVKKEYSCAGSTRALGMVLDIMGYKWKHVNENQYKHQWCRLQMDGKTGYADGQVGWAGYGKHPVE